MSLVSAIINILLYSIGYFKVKSSKVEGDLIKIKRVMLLDLIVILLSAICFALVFSIVIFIPQFTTPALYFLGTVLFALNLSYNIKALSLVAIVKSYEKRV